MAHDVPNIIAANFDKLPENTRSELLLKLADIPVPFPVRHDTEMPIGQDTINLRYWHTVANIIAANFDKLPANVQNLLFKLADNKDAATGVAHAVGSNFKKLPESVRNDLLIKIASDKDAAYAVVDAVANNFFHFSEKVRNELQERLAKHGYSV